MINCIILNSNVFAIWYFSSFFSAPEGQMGDPGPSKSTFLMDFRREGSIPVENSAQEFSTGIMVPLGSFFFLGEKF